MSLISFFKRGLIALLSDFKPDRECDHLMFASIDESGDGSTVEWECTGCGEVRVECDRMGIEKPDEIKW